MTRSLNTSPSLASLSPESWGETIIGGQSPVDVVTRIRAKMIQPWVHDIYHEAKQVAASSKALELGSGTGEIAGFLSIKGFDVTLVDFSEGALGFSRQVFRRLLREASFVNADVTKPLPFDDESFDVVYSSGLLEHFDMEQQAEIIREAYRVAKAVVITLVPNAASLPYRLGKHMQEQLGIWKWGKEDPMFSLEGVYALAGIDFEKALSEYSTAPYHALNFLRPCGLSNAAAEIERFYKKIEEHRIHFKRMNQGYLLVSVLHKF